MDTSDNTIIEQMIALADKRYNCSQIMMTLSLNRSGLRNPDLVRAMAGLGDGCGFFNETCGILTSGVSVLSMYGAKGGDDEAESDDLAPMLQDFGDWFGEKTRNSFQGTRCREIVGDKVGTESGKMICGGLILEAHLKINDILETYHFSKMRQV